jgi:hypothetical protein
MIEGIKLFVQDIWNEHRDLVHCAISIAIIAGIFWILQNLF